jgi:hypothetical protein
MKKTLLFCAALVLGLQLYGDIPPRYFEFGFDLDAGAANNYLGLTDVLNPEKKIKVDLNLLPVDKGLGLDAIVEFQTFLRGQGRGKHKVGFGLSVGLEADVYTLFPGTLMEFLSKGNAGIQSFSEGLDAGASVFAGVAIETHAKFGKLTLGLSPALFIPVAYAPKPSGKIALDTSSALKGEFFVDADVYTPISIEGLIDSSGSFEINPWAILEARGFDFSLDAEYELLPALDLGVSVSHIPLAPALLNYRMHAHTAYSFNQNGDAWGILDILEDDFNFDDVFTEEALEMTYDDNAAFRVFRPLDFDFFIRYKPLKTKSIILKPNFGFSVLTVYEKACFNAGLEGKLDLKNCLSLTIGSGYRDRFWRHDVALMFNFRVIEVNIAVSLQSQSFKDSFEIKGARVFAGLRLGF